MQAPVPACCLTGGATSGGGMQVLQLLVKVPAKLAKLQLPYRVLVAQSDGRLLLDLRGQLSGGYQTFRCVHGLLLS
jgi:hypothetical protein